MWGFPGGSDSKESACNAREPGIKPGKVPWRRKWLSTPVFLPGEFHGKQCLAGYSPWCHKESDMTERLICGKHRLYTGGEVNKALCTHGAHSLERNISS